MSPSSAKANVLRLPLLAQAADPPLVKEKHFVVIRSPHCLLVRVEHQLVAFKVRSKLVSVFCSVCLSVCVCVVVQSIPFRSSRFKQKFLDVCYFYAGVPYSPSNLKWFPVELPVSWT